MPGLECSKVRKAMGARALVRKGQSPLEKQKMSHRGGGSLRGEEETQETSSSRESLLQGISKWLFFHDVRFRITPVTMIKVMIFNFWKI